MFILSASEDILSFITGFGILQGFLLALLIYFHPRSNRTVNLFLALYIGCLSVIASTPFVERAVTWQKSFFIEPFPFLAGPLLYFYIRSFKETITWRKAIPHLLPFIAIFFVAGWYLGSMAEKYPLAKEVPAEAVQTPFAIMFNVVKLSQMGLYYWLSRRSVRSYRRSIRQLFSETSRIDQNWIQWLINGYILFIIATLGVFSMMYKYPDNFYLWALIYVALLTPYIYMATFKGITQSTIWQIQPGKNKENIEEEMEEASKEIMAETKENKTKQVTTATDDSRVNEITSRIVAAMEKDKLYQEPELSLQNLADKLLYPSYQVSQAINEGMKKNFYDLINGYRVEEAKRLLVDEKSRNYTILSVGFEAGFNSKTTFNTVFKRFTGCTPTEFREKQKARLIPAS